jgi:plastocyanin
MNKSRFLVALLAVVSLVGVGCNGDDDDDAADEATTTAAEEAEGAPESVTIVADDFEFTETPDELTAGVIELTLDNQGEVAHEVALAEIGDTSIDQFVSDFPGITEGGPFPDYLDAVAAPIEVDAGASGDVTFTITEGDYALFCALTGAVAEDGTTTSAAEGEEAEEPEGPPHLELGMVQAITVAAGEADPALPEADGTITAVDYDFEVDIEAGDAIVNFVNEGPEQVHFAGVSVFPEGTDAAAAEQAFAQLLAAEEDAPPPEGVPLPEDVGFSGIFSAGLGSSFELFTGEFEAGRTYLLACFIQDRAGGPPHAIGNNMYTAFTVE